MILAPGSYTIIAELSGYSFTSATAQVQTNAFSTAPRIVGYWASAATYRLPSALGSTMDSSILKELLDGSRAEWRIRPAQAFPMRH